MSLELRPLVAEAKSFASTSATFIPRSAASRKIDAPVIPPPITRRSNVSSDSFRNIVGREHLLNVCKLICVLCACLRFRPYDVVEIIATRLNLGVQAVEATVIQQGLINFRVVIVGFVSDVST